MRLCPFRPLLRLSFALAASRGCPLPSTSQHRRHVPPASAQSGGCRGAARAPAAPLPLPAWGGETPAPPDLLCALSPQSKGSLEVTESQSADAEPPPPPKPDLSRYTGLRTHLTLATTEGKEGTQGQAALGGEPRAAPGGAGARAAGTGCRADPEHISAATVRSRTCCLSGLVHVAPCVRAAHRQRCSLREGRRLCQAGTGHGGCDGQAAVPRWPCRAGCRAAAGTGASLWWRRRSGSRLGSATEHVCGSCGLAFPLPKHRRSSTGSSCVGLARGGMQRAELEAAGASAALPSPWKGAAAPAAEQPAAPEHLGTHWHLRAAPTPRGCGTEQQCQPYTVPR